MADTKQNILDSGNTLIDTSDKTSHICIEFKTDAIEQLQKHADPRSLWTTI